MALTTADSIRRWVAAATAAALLVACGGGASLDAPPAKQTIGAAGGSLTSPDGRLTLTVPPGALAAATEITIGEPAATLPAAVKAIGADRVYRFEPAGLVFAQPVTVRLALPASPQVAIALLHSTGSWETPLSQTLTMAADGRMLTAQLGHFSELAVKPLDLTYSFDVEPVELEVQQTLVARAALAKSAELDDIEVDERIPLASGFEQTASSEQLRFEPPSRTAGTKVLPPFTAAGYSRESTFRCLRPHVGEVSTAWELEFTTLLPAILKGVATTRVDGAKSYVCHSRPPTPEELRTGIFTLPLGMTAPDGVGVFQGPFANLPGGTSHALIGGNNGAIAIDLKTGAVSLDMTASGADGRLGSDTLLGVEPVSAPGPGANTPAALFGTSGIGGAVRGYTLPVQSNFFRWGATLLTRTQMLDAATAGGGLVAEEVMTTVPGTGLNFYRLDADRWLQTLEQVRAFRFDGTLRSAVLPEPGLGKPLLALTAGSLASGFSAVWAHTRDPNAEAVRLFSIAGADARRLRCTPWGLFPSLGNRVLCGATQSQGTVSLFRYDAAAPTATPQVQTVRVGAGPVGLQWGRRSNGKPWLLTANYDVNTLNVLDFDDNGALVSNTSLPVPEACVRPAHAAPVSAGGRDYIVATCYISGHLLVIDNTPGR